MLNEALTKALSGFYSCVWHGILMFVCFALSLQTLASLSLPLLVHQQKSLPALRLSLLNSQQSLTQPLQPGVKPAPGGTPPAIVAGPAVRIRHPNSVSTTVGASALPTGTLGHAAGMVCMEQSSGTSFIVDKGITCLDLLFTLRLNWRQYLLHETVS